MRRICSYYPSFLTLAVILYATLSAAPPDEVRFILFPGADKLIHAIMFGGLCGAILFDTYRSAKPEKANLSFLVLAITAITCATIGIIVEILQEEMDLGRTADIADFCADCIGIIIALITAPPVIRKVVKRRK